MKKIRATSKIFAQKVTLSRSKTIKQRVGTFFARVRGLNYRKPASFIQRRPFASFFIALFVLFLLIVLGSTAFKQKVEEVPQQNQIKDVQTFKLGSAPKVTAQAEVQKSGVVNIVAQMPGIVSAVNTSEGQSVGKGTVLLSLATNYQGGNALSLSRQIAQNQLNLSSQTYDTQKDLITKQREAAERTDANSDQLRDIQNQSLDETRSTLDLNESIVSQLDTALQSLSPSDPTYLQTEQAKSQFQSAVNQLRSAIRNTEYSSAGDKPPAQLSDLQREITMKQLDIQDKSLEVNKQIASLQYQLAAVNEANMYPASPYAGVVEKINVKIGQSISPGDVLAVLSGVVDPIKLDAKVPAQVAKNVSLLEDSTIEINGKIISAKPAYVSTEATNGQLYSIIYNLDDQYKSLFTDGGFVNIEIPVGVADSNGIIPFIPVDAVFQTQEESYVYVVEGDRAKVKKVNLGEVSGRFASVQDGLSSEDQIILNRNVVDGDQIKVSN